MPREGCLREAVCFPLAVVEDAGDLKEGRRKGGYEIKKGRKEEGRERRKILVKIERKVKSRTIRKERNK